jgi:chromosome segregation ATPase
MDDEGGDNGIYAVADRIQSHAVELAKERALVELAKSELEQLQRVLDEETRKNGAVRRSMLSTMQARHGVELKLWKIREQHEALLSKLDEYQRETDEAKDQVSELQEVWEKDVRELYVDHDLKLELYKRSVQGRIRRRERRIEERERRLRAVRDAEEAYQKASKEMTKWEQKRMELANF